jgi:hypothetical protein
MRAMTSSTANIPLQGSTFSELTTVAFVPMFFVGEGDSNYARWDNVFKFDFQNCRDSVSKHLLGRTFIVSDSWLIGIRPAEVMAGDGVFVVLGSQVPLSYSQTRVDASSLLGNAMSMV